MGKQIQNSECQLSHPAKLVKSQLCFALRARCKPSINNKLCYPYPSKLARYFQPIFDLFLTIFSALSILNKSRGHHCTMEYWEERKFVKFNSLKISYFYVYPQSPDVEPWVFRWTFILLLLSSFPFTPLTFLSKCGGNCTVDHVSCSDNVLLFFLKIISGLYTIYPFCSIHQKPRTQVFELLLLLLNICNHNKIFAALSKLFHLFLLGTETIRTNCEKSNKIKCFRRLILYAELDCLMFIN